MQDKKGQIAGILSVGGVFLWVGIHSFEEGRFCGSHRTVRLSSCWLAAFSFPVLRCADSDLHRFPCLLAWFSGLVSDLYI